MSDPKVFSGPDHQSYLEWLKANPDGIVVNGLDLSGRALHSSYPGGAVRHWADCGTIGGQGGKVGRVRNFIGQFPKACWPRRADFDDWLARPGSPPSYPSCPACKHRFESS